MLKAIDKNTFSFVIKEKTFMINFKDNNKVTLKEDQDREIYFDDINQFKLFCNSITDIIEFYENSRGKKDV